MGRLDPPADLNHSKDAIAELSRRLPQTATWITSGSRRAVETARALAEARHASPELIAEPDLLEQDFGAWQGLTHAEAAAQAPDAAARFWRDPARETPPGGESFAAVVTRVARAIDRLAAESEGDLVLIAHAGTIRAALAHALEMEPAAALRFAIEPLSLTRLDRFPPESGRTRPGWRVGFVNLPTLETPAFARD